MDNYLFYYFVLFSSWIPVIFIVIQRRINTNQTRLKSLFFLFIVSRCLTDLGVIILEKLIINTFPVFHFSVIIQFILILELFYSIHRYTIPKSVFVILSVVFFTLDLTVTSNITQNNHISTMYSYIVISGFGIGYLFKYHGDYFQKIILSSTSIYSIAFTFLLFFEELFFSSKELNNYLLNFMALLSLSLNLIFSYTLCLKSKS